MKKAFIGVNYSPVSSSLRLFEEISVEDWSRTRQGSHIPEGFLFLVGIIKYRERFKSVAPYKFGKDYIFVQNMLPNSATVSVQNRRGFGALYSFYEPSNLYEDDIVLTESCIYQALPNERFRKVMDDGEHRRAACVAQMFQQIRADHKLEDFSTEKLPMLYQVQFKKKSCGYFLKDRTYIVWAMPVGIPDFQLDRLNKGWIFCDVFCGIPSIIEFERESFEKMNLQDGDLLAGGLFTFQDNALSFNPSYKS